MLEMWAKDNPDLSMGILLFGSYLPNGFLGNGDTNVFPVPVLTAVGSLDGGSLSYVAREARESKNPVLQGRYPVLVIDRVNHAQVASGEIPDVVIQNDVDAEVDNEEAFVRYSIPSVAFMVAAGYESFDPELVAEQLTIMNGLLDFTDQFLLPFEELRLLEQSEDQKESPWINQAQQIISGASDNDLANLQVSNQLVGFTEIGGVKPSIVSESCTAQVVTYGYNSYPLDPLDFGGLISADVIKAKFKLEDIVQEALCEEVSSRRQCADVNAKALELALDVAAPEAKERYLTKGRQLVFGDDYVSPWGPGWEFSFGLHYANINETHRHTYHIDPNMYQSSKKKTRQNVFRMQGLGV